MFSFRRKPKKDANQQPQIRTSPSLPELSAQGIPWPESLVDPSALPEPVSPSKGAERTKFNSERSGVPAFHRPWVSSGNGRDSPSGGTISSLYMSHPPSAFENRKGSFFKRSRPSQRKARNPTTFNVMVVGAQGTGKTSLLRLLLDTADISPTATPDQKANMERFLKGSTKRTDSIQTACVEICESKYDRVLLSVVDTPGLDFQNGHELKLERQVTHIVKYMDTQFFDTLSEESKVVRQSKGDQHIHLCIYTIDPSSIMTASARRVLSALPTQTRSEATVSHKPHDISATQEFEDEDSEDEDDWVNLTISPADIRVIRRLAKKKVIRRDLDAAGLDFGVFGPAKTEDTTPKPETHQEQVNGDSNTNGHAQANGTSNGNGHHANGGGGGDAEEHSADEQEERRSRPVIKLRAIRLPKRLSRSRSRLELAESENEPTTAEITDNESVASIRFSAHVVAKTDLSEILPFALIAPEHVQRRRALKAAPPPASISEDQHSESAHTDAVTSPSEDGHAMSVAESTLTSPTSPSMNSLRNFSYLSGPPADLRGVFVRRYRWGTIDVLSPEHCDFAALRTAVLSTHMKMLKIRTKEVLYEKFRTEKLLARRATQNIGEQETRRLLEDLGL
ncbi:unnamed protein product [Somion occarium]|uniref:Septin-type G domain-containing protein n=1 Tax=Somion occarium TaxID=3059160 RepID=A0ABP1DXS3_9APHY